MTGDERSRDENPARHGVRDFLVPDLGEGLEDATITSWSVAVGDTVELNQTLCTVETNKAEVEIPSPYAGRIAELGGREGETLNVGAVLVRIATGAEPVVESTAKRKPVLVGYGADDAMDSSRRAVGCAVSPAADEAAGAQAGGGAERGSARAGGLRSRRCDHPR